MKEGFLMGGGLLVCGLLLEVSAGPVVWDSLRWPANIILLAAFALVIAAMHLLRSRVYVFRFLSTLYAAVPALVCAVLLTLVMGLTRQTADGRRLHNMLTFWPFVLAWAWLAVILALTLVRRLAAFRLSAAHLRRDIPFVLSHAGLLTALLCATLGNADMQRLHMVTAVGDPEWRAMNSAGDMVELPLAVELQRFIMETYDDGSPRRFASDIRILTRSGKNIHTTVEVNRPVEVDGWKLYQYGYDTRLGPLSRISVLELVRDPWLPAVYAGIWMMLGGAVCLFVFGKKKENSL